MKKIIISENKFNVLLEYSGFVNKYMNLIDYIYKYSYENLCKMISKVVDTKGKTKDVIIKEFINSDMVSADKPMRDWIISENYISMTNVDDIRQITIVYMTDENMGAYIDRNNLRMDSDGKIRNVVIGINIIPLFTKGEAFKSLLQHEFTHLYEFINRYKKNGVDKTNMNFDNKYYSTKSDIVSFMSYYFSKVEMNAVISETMHVLINGKPKNEEDAWNLIKNSNAMEFINQLNTIENALKNNIRNVYAVMEFLKMNPEHVDMFPSVRNNNVGAYQRRLVKVAELKKEYFQNKIKKTIKTYLLNRF